MPNDYDTINTFFAPRKFEDFTPITPSLKPRLSYLSPEATPTRIRPYLLTSLKPSTHNFAVLGHGLSYKLPPCPSPQVELRKSAVCGGHGLFATRDFAQGDLVFAEAPWLTVPVREDVDSAPSHKSIAAAVEAAIDDDIYNEARYHFLHPVCAGGEPSLRAKRDKKFETNCWQTIQPRRNPHGMPIADAAGRPIFDHHRRIGYLLSMPNHACTPDLQPTWRPTEQRWVVHALRAIRAGEELFVSYDQAKDWNVRADRQLALDFSHSFRCACAACICLDAEVRRMQYQGFRRALSAADMRRVKAVGDLVVAARLSHDAWTLVWRDLDSVFASGQSVGESSTRLETIPRRVSPRFIEACEDLARRSIDAYIGLAGKHPDLAASTAFGRHLFRLGALVYESAEEAYVVCYGADDPHVQEVRERHDSHWQTLLRACGGRVPVGHFEGDEDDCRCISLRWRARSLVVRLRVRLVEKDT